MSRILTSLQLSYCSSEENWISYAVFLMKNLYLSFFLSEFLDKEHHGKMPQPKHYSSLEFLLLDKLFHYFKM